MASWCKIVFSKRWTKKPEAYPIRVNKSEYLYKVLQLQRAIGPAGYVGTIKHWVIDKPWSHLKRHPLECVWDGGDKGPVAPILLGPQKLYFV